MTAYKLPMTATWAIYLVERFKGLKAQKFKSSTIGKPKISRAANDSTNRQKTNNNSVQIISKRFLFLLKNTVTLNFT